MLVNLIAKVITFDASAGKNKRDLPLTRRQFLTGSGILMGALVVGTPLAVVAPSTAWALELTTLDTAAGETLLKLGRILYPHPNLPDAVYAILVKDLDAMAAANPKVAAQLREGVRSLDQATGGSFVKAETAAQLAAVKVIEGSPLFVAVRSQCVTSLYNNEMTWTIFGYPGESWSKGGYIARGFQDLKWLQAPPQSVSPPPYFG